MEVPMLKIVIEHYTTHVLSLYFSDTMSCTMPISFTFLS